MCYYNVGFSCVSNRCQCATNYYWTGSVCHIYMTYGQSCSSYLCNPSFNLTCSSGSGTGCSCPNTYGISVCDCDATKYWSGSACVTRSTYGESCPTGNTYNCYKGKYLICSGGTCVCANSNYYWVPALSMCSKY